MCELVLLSVCVDQRPAVKEKLAASLILLRVALLLGLSADSGVFMSGGGGGLVAAEFSVLPSSSDVLPATAATAGSLSEITHTVQTEQTPLERQERCK